MANGDEYMFPGGFYDPKQQDRTDIYISECGPGINEAKGIPLTLELGFTTGSANILIGEILPNDLIRIGKWLQQIGQEITDREKAHA